MTTEADHGPSGELRILHLDDDLVAVDKPPWMSVHRGPRSKENESFVLQRLAGQIGRYLFPVHRLDHNTSGVLSFALSKPMAARLQERITAEDSVKQYLVLSRGEAPDRFESDRPLTGRSGELQDARTEFETIARFNRCSLLRARLFTGRTHQIRRHLDHLAHQVIGDSTHGKGRINKMFRERFGLPRMVLHAERLRIRHPADDRPLDLHAPLAQDLREFLTRLPECPTDLLASI
ncbi:MAG: pseudouridine synthase [Planctomycetota bacterium]